MAALRQPGSQLFVIVNLAVKDEPDAIGAATHRLVTGFRQIDDRQPAKTKAAAPFVKEQLARVVRSAMRHHVAHALNQRALDSAFSRSVFPDSADSAHYLFSIAGCSLPIGPSVNCLMILSRSVSSSPARTGTSTNRAASGAALRTVQQAETDGSLAP